MLPMGTIMTVCMAVGVLFAARPLGLHRASPRRLLETVGVVLLLAGLWNALWHAPRHLDGFWGWAALGSGSLMLLVAAFLLVPTRLPPPLVRARPLVVLALAGCTLLYGIGIYRL